MPSSELYCPLVALLVRVLPLGAGESSLSLRNDQRPL
jgi:hypothetical protein